MTISENIEFIESGSAVAALSALISDLKKSDYIALDTEFTRVKSYYPLFDLLQLQIGPKSYIVDPLACDLTPLFKALNTTEALVLMFSCREDLEVIYRYCKSHDVKPALPRRIADIQILQAFLNISFTQGLQSSLLERLGIDLDKSETLSDWSARPLSDAQLSYAANDVIYLEALYKACLNTVACDDIRLKWFFRQMEETLEEAQIEIEPELIYMYIQGAGSLTAKQLKTLYYISTKREIFARSHNIALGRICSNKCLVQVAVATPLTFQGLASCKLKWGAIRQHGNTLIGWVKEALSHDEYEILKQPLDFVVNTKEGSDEARRLKFILDTKARAHSIRPELLLQKSYVYEYLYDLRKPQILARVHLKGSWRQECVGIIEAKALKKD